MAKKKAAETQKTTAKKAPAKRTKAATDEAAELLERVEDSLELDTWLQAIELSDDDDASTEKALAVLVESGRAERREEAGVVLYRAKIDPQPERRAAVLRAMALDERRLSAIATEAGVDTAQVAAELRQLERAGYVRIDREDDGWWSLSDETMDAIAQLGAVAFARASYPEEARPAQDAIAAVVTKLLDAGAVVSMEELRVGAGLSEEALAIALKTLGDRVRIDGAGEERTVSLTAKAQDHVELLGVSALARELAGGAPGGGPAAPKAELDAAQARVEELKAKAVESKKLLDEKDSQIARARTWLEEHGVDAIEIMGLPRPKPVRKIFTWSQARQITESEKGVIFDEVLAIEAKIAARRLELESDAEEHKAAIKDLMQQIAALKSATLSNQRVISCDAYVSTVDWERGVEVVRALADDRVLEERAIPKGTQRPIPQAEKTQEAEAETEKSAPAAPPEPVVGETASDATAGDGPLAKKSASNGQAALL